MHAFIKTIQWVALVLGWFLITCTFLSLIYNTSLWYFKILNFPRLQALIILMICLAVYVSIKKRKTSLLFAGGVIIAIVINTWYLFPYFPLAKTKLAQADETTMKKDSRFSILLANVYMKNNKTSGLLNIINNKQPTFVLVMEVNNWWLSQLQPIQKDYPYVTSFPTGNTYGMALYSKLPLEQPETLFFNHDSVPSFYTTITLPNKASFRLLTVHPVAPKASKHPDNVNDKEVGLMKAARKVAETSTPVIVAGDFNDVGWSHNMNRFEEISGLKDTRYGRGLYNTFSAHNIMMRWPLDYVYASPQFKVVSIERLSKFGSDHFPLLVELELDK